MLEAVGDGIFLLDSGIPDWEALAVGIPVAEEGAMARPVTLPIEIAGHDLSLSFVAVRIADGAVYAFRDVTSEQLLEEVKSDFAPRSRTSCVRR